MKRIALYTRGNKAVLVEFNPEFNDYCVSFFIDDRLHTELTQDVKYLSVATQLAQDFIKH